LAALRSSRVPPVLPLRLAPLAAALCAPALLWAQQTSTPRADADKRLPVVLQAERISGQPDLETVAEGAVELQRGPLVIRADRLSYDNATDLARAVGQVRITHDGDRFAGPELQLQLQRFEGFFLQPDYFFALTGAGGHAERIDFLDSQRSRLWSATYTSCEPDGTGTPAWLLETKRVALDFEANEGVAEGAVLRFYGVPILAAPTMSFPLTDDRKSGWLPPTVDLSSNSGFELGVPYYWNIAPNRDATLTPAVISRRGLALETEFRYLAPRDHGQLQFDVLPNDRVAERSRHSLQFFHEGEGGPGLHYRAKVARVSDDDYWKDFRRDSAPLTPRLLPTDLLAERRFERGSLDLHTYARVQQWQVLQSLDAPIVAPYQRSPQLGVAGLAPWSGFELSFETELNHFTRQDDPPGTDLPTGTRWHALTSISRPWRAPGWWLVPKFTLNLASYRTDQPMADGRSDASRAIHTASVDGGMLFERGTQWFGRAMRQTLEPRVFYVNTPFKQQDNLPAFDSAGKDFNDVSVYSDNAFTGIDRVSDAHQMTAGVTTRLIDAASGVEALRLGLAQRYLFSDQRVTANPDGSPDGPEFTQRFSDVLLLGAATLSPRWTLDAAVQYSPEIDRAMRSIVSARYSPGPFRTVSTGYRLTRGLSEQIELGWQWPLYQSGKDVQANGSCRGSLYGVGRVNYSLQDSRIIDSIVGFEYDAGCWIGRVVAERLSTGRTEATTRLLIQLELVGLSRLGSNPLKVLKDNIPGYQLLREERGSVPSIPRYD
jgi:LPS-assembly protein